MWRITQPRSLLNNVLLQTSDQLDLQSIAVSDEPEFTTAALGDGLDDGEPEPAAVPLAVSPESFSESFDLLCSDDRSVIDHREANLVFSMLLQ